MSGERYVERERERERDRDRDRDRDRETHREREREGSTVEPPKAGTDTAGNVEDT